ncbi:MAG TPA: pyrroline-5-carboxylate reductase, partial [Burkholderiales bacterium]|nr:pyrroline-5-carboxylate reductase [Burkholderiales bacterium]
AVGWHGGADALPDALSPDAVVFAVKPQVMDDVLPAYRRWARPRTLFVSIAAGKTIGGIARHLGEGAAIVRCMPNTPAAIGRSITVACANPMVSARQRKLASNLLSAIGKVEWASDETLMDAVTALSGSGPAYVFLLAEAMASAGIAAGLPPALATRLAHDTVAGSGELLHHSQLSAATLRENVTSPGGTTAAALDVLLGPGGLEELMTKAIAAATRRSRDLAG